ncbi:hypothetical protein NMY22_g18193 [Coprinellus aureogranulatus]|nr:hypothetical protein NMY22_g18193 [Coprinellus aureogranulatus]
MKLLEVRVVSTTTIRILAYSWNLATNGKILCQIIEIRWLESENRFTGTVSHRLAFLDGMSSILHNRQFLDEAAIFHYSNDRTVLWDFASVSEKPDLPLDLGPPCFNRCRSRYRSNEFRKVLNRPLATLSTSGRPAVEWTIFGLQPGFDGLVCGPSGCQRTPTSPALESGVGFFRHDRCISWLYQPDSAFQFTRDAVFSNNSQTHVFYATAVGVSCFVVPPLQPVPNGEITSTALPSARLIRVSSWAHSGLTISHRDIVSPEVFIPPAREDSPVIRLQVRVRTNDAPVRSYMSKFAFDEEIPERSTLEAVGLTRYSQPSNEDSSLARIVSEYDFLYEGNLVTLWCDDSNPGIQRNNDRFVTIAPTLSTPDALPRPSSTTVPLVRLERSQSDRTFDVPLSAFCPNSGAFLFPKGHEEGPTATLLCTTTTTTSPGTSQTLRRVLSDGNMQLLSVDLQLAVVAELCAADIPPSGDCLCITAQTCKHFYNLIEEFGHGIWKNCLQRQCSEGEIFWPTYKDLAEAAEFKNAVTSPARLYKMYTEVSSSLRFPEPTRTTFDIPSSIPQGDLNNFVLIPGGRFIVILQESERLSLWDIAQGFGAAGRQAVDLHQLLSIDIEYADSLLGIRIVEPTMIRGLLERNDDDGITTYQVFEVCWLENEDRFTGKVTHRLTFFDGMSFMDFFHFLDDCVIFHFEDRKTVFWNFTDDECISWTYPDEGSKILQIFTNHSRTHVFYGTRIGITGVKVPQLQPAGGNRPSSTQLPSVASIDTTRWAYKKPRIADIRWDHGRKFYDLDLLSPWPPGNTSANTWQINATISEGNLRWQTYDFIFNETHPEESIPEAFNCYCVQGTKHGLFCIESHRLGRNKLASLWADLNHSRSRRYVTIASTTGIPRAQSSAPKILPLVCLTDCEGSMETAFRFCPVSGKFVIIDPRGREGAVVVYDFFVFLELNLKRLYTNQLPSPGHSVPPVVITMVNRPPEALGAVNGSHRQKAVLQKIQT